jgi:RNase H-fold protein (predicted Holliday junction resolvase)
MKILSIDASSKSTGIAIFENKQLIHCENIVADSSDSINRINKMVKRIQELYL